jgi:Domain of Unknown Function (DUF1080)
LDPLALTTENTMLKRFTALLSACLTATLLAACATPGGGWETLIEGDKGLENWNRLGDANWRAEGGLIVADQGKGGFLVSKKSYKDFVLTAEFWAARDTNSGIFIRAADAAKIGADSSYEVNIWDIRPDPKFGTGGIVDFAAVPVPAVFSAGGKWNNFEIEARGDTVTVKLNGVTTVSLKNSKYASGPFALQFGAGVQGALGGPIKWRQVMIKAL